MAFDAYLRFAVPPVDGQATLDSTYKPEPSGEVTNDKWISIDEYAFSATMAVTAARSGGTGAATTGKGKFEPFTFKKNVDATSMSLAFHASAGTIFKKIIINVFTSLAAADGSTHEPKLFLIATMSGAVINSCKLSGGGGDELPTEEVSISYGAITYEYRGFKVDADSGAISAGSKIRFSWNTITNSGAKG